MERRPFDSLVLSLRSHGMPRRGPFLHCLRSLKERLAFAVLHPLFALSRSILFAYRTPLALILECVPSEDF